MASNYKVGVEITADSKSVDKSLKTLETKLKDLGKSFQTVGKNLSLYVTAPIIALSGVAVKNFGVQEAAISKLNQSLKNAGTFSKEASLDIQAFASALQESSIFGDEVILQSFAMARNFTKSNEEAKKLTAAAVELSAVTGDSLDTSIKDLGKSLEGMAGKLAESVPGTKSFTEAQLKAGAAINYVAKQFAGSALAESKTFNGQIVQLKNSFGDFLEVVGAQLAPIISRFVTTLNDLVNALNKMEPVLRNQIIVFGLVAASIGPILIGIGFLAKAFAFMSGALASLIQIIKGAILILSGPTGFILAIVGVGVAIAGTINLIYQLQKATDSWSKAFVISFEYAYYGFLRVFVAPFLNTFDNIYSLLGKIPGLNAIYNWDANAENFRSWRQEIITGLSLASGTVSETLASTGTDLASVFTFGLSDVFKEFTDKLKNQFSLPVAEELKSVVKTAEKESKKLSDFQKELAKSAADTVTGSFTNAYSEIASGTKSVSEAFKDMADSILQDLSRIILQKSLTQALAGLFPAALGSGGGSAVVGNVASTGAYVNNGKLTHRYAAGGMVRGPGTGTSDSIPARLSNGEFVTDAKTVSHFGPDFFLNLKRMARSFSSPSPILNGVHAFASGGYVNGMGSGETRIMVQNSGSPKEATNVTTEQDAQGMVVNIILEDIQKNGNISKSFQTNYGLKRGGI